MHVLSRFMRQKEIKSLPYYTIKVVSNNEVKIKQQERQMAPPGITEGNYKAKGGRLKKIC